MRVVLVITSTLDSYLELAAVPSGPERVRAWVDQYEAAHDEIFTAYYRGFGDPGERAASAVLVDGLVAQLAGRERRLRELFAGLESRFVSQGILASGSELPVVLMVGTGGSDGWVDVFRGVPTLFVALEMIGEPPADELLLIHELVHVAHYRALWPTLGRQPQLRDQVGFRVWAEGLAVAGTRLLSPGHPDAAYLFVDSGSGDAGQWFADCRTQLPVLAKTLLAGLTEIDPRLAYALCGVTNDQPWPSRAGYWLGDLIVRELLDAGHRLESLLSWQPDQVAEAIRHSSVLQSG